MRLLDLFVRDGGHAVPLAYHHPNWSRRHSPLLDHLGAAVDQVVAFSKDGAHIEENFSTSCNKCNIRKNVATVADFASRHPKRSVKGKYGEPEHWDGLSTLFVLLATQHPEQLSDGERGWLRVLGAVAAPPDRDAI